MTVKIGIRNLRMLKSGQVQQILSGIMDEKIGKVW